MCQGLLTLFFTNHWVKIDLKLGDKAHGQKIEEEATEANKAMQRNAETMAAFAQQLAQPKAQAMAQPNNARTGGPPYPFLRSEKKHGGHA